VHSWLGARSLLDWRVRVPSYTPSLWSRRPPSWSAPPVSPCMLKQAVPWPHPLASWEMSICLHLRRCPCFSDLWSLGRLGLHLATSSLTRWPPVLVCWRSEHANFITGDYTSPPTFFPSASQASHQHTYTIVWCHVIISVYQGGTATIYQSHPCKSHLWVRLW